MIIFFSLSKNGKSTISAEWVSPLGKEINEMPLTRPGVSHSITGSNYGNRMEAINFALGHDDGMTHSGLNQAQVILVGVSRSGKTPTSIYLIPLKMKKEIFYILQTLAAKRLLKF